MYNASVSGIFIIRESHILFALFRVHSTARSIILDILYFWVPCIHNERRVSCVTPSMCPPHTRSQTLVVLEIISSEKKNALQNSITSNGDVFSYVRFLAFLFGYANYFSHRAYPQKNQEYKYGFMYVQCVFTLKVS